MHPLPLIKAYIIHCYTTTPAPHVRRLVAQLRAAGIDASVFRCIHYKREWLTKSGKPNAVFQRLHKKKIIDAAAHMTGVEHAIALSHKLALHKIHRNKRCEYGLILEDDVTLQRGFAEELGRLLEATRDHRLKRIREFGVFYLWNTNAASTRSKMKRVVKEPLIYEETVPHNAGGVAYLVSKAFAAKEMRRPFPIRDPSDVHNGYTAFKRYKKAMAFLSVQMQVADGACRARLDTALSRIRRRRWTNDRCITSPLVHTNWYDDSTSHTDDDDVEDFSLRKWEHFATLDSKRAGNPPRKYRIAA